jgi:hypothetical protein
MEARNPSGYELQKLYLPLNMAAQRVPTHAEMAKNAGTDPRLFVIDNDEATGRQDVFYLWTGIEASLIPIEPSIGSGPATGVRKLDNWQVPTKSAATSFAATLDYSAFIEVISDESNEGLRTLYYWNTLSLQEPLLL